MQYLRYATAVIVAVGPFLDKTDGVTLETALTITNERITLVAETDDGSAPTNVLDNVTGATSGTSNDLNYITGNDAGMMQLELSAANLNRLGRVRLIITDAANHCPVFHEFCILPEPIYDAMFADGGTFGDVLVSTTIATLASQTSFTLTSASADNSAYGIGAMVIVRDATTKVQVARGTLSAYTGSTKTVTLLADPGIFTMAVGDFVQIVAQPVQIGTVAPGAIGGLPSFAQVDTIDDLLDTEIGTLTTAMGLLQTYTKNVAVTAFTFPMLTTAGAAATGKTVAGVIIKDGGAEAAIAGAISEISSGFYKVNLTQTEMNADEIGLAFTATGCNPTFFKIRTQG